MLQLTTRRKSVSEITATWSKSLFAVSLFFTAGPALIMINKVCMLSVVVGFVFQSCFAALLHQ